MISTLVFCASIMLPLADPTAEAKPEQKVEQKAGAVAAEARAGSAARAEKKAEDNASQADETKADDLELLPIEANVISYTNAERAKYNLPPLEADKDLMQSARDHCSWMTTYRNFSHTRRPVAENIAMGQANSSEAVRAWMNSSGHRANILNPRHRRIGVGAFRTQNGTIYWCQQFRP
jgi:uncharacterized protein YkwD